MTPLVIAAGVAVWLWTRSRPRPVLAAAIPVGPVPTMRTLALTGRATAHDEHDLSSAIAWYAQRPGTSSMQPLGQGPLVVIRPVFPGAWRVRAQVMDPRGGRAAVARGGFTAVED